MTERHDVKCDRCDKVKRMETGFFDDEDFKTPENFREFNIDHGKVQGHLCDDCWFKYLAVEELFMESKIEETFDLHDPNFQASIKRDKNEDN